MISARLLYDYDYHEERSRLQLSAIRYSSVCLSFLFDFRLLYCILVGFGGSF